MPLSCLLHFPLSSSATNQPMSQVGRLFGRDQPQQVLQRIDLPLEPSDVLKNDHSCFLVGLLLVVRVMARAHLFGMTGQFTKETLKMGIESAWAK